MTQTATRRAVMLELPRVQKLAKLLMGGELDGPKRTSALAAFASHILAECLDGQRPRVPYPAAFGRPWESVERAFDGDPSGKSIRHDFGIWRDRVLNAEAANAKHCSLVLCGARYATDAGAAGLASELLRHAGRAWGTRLTEAPALIDCDRVARSMTLRVGLLPLEWREVS